MLCEGLRHTKVPEADKESPLHAAEEGSLLAFSICADMNKAAQAADNREHKLQEGDTFHHEQFKRTAPSFEGAPAYHTNPTVSSLSTYDSLSMPLSSRASIESSALQGQHIKVLSGCALEGNGNTRRSIDKPGSNAGSLEGAERFRSVLCVRSVCVSVWYKILVHVLSCVLTKNQVGCFAWCRLEEISKI